MSTNFCYYQFPKEIIKRAQKGNIIQLRRNKVTSREIAIQFNTTLATIKYLFRKHKETAVKNKKFGEHYEEWKTLYENGSNTSEIAKKFNTSSGFVSRVLRKLNVKMDKIGAGSHKKRNKKEPFGSVVF